MTHVSVKLLSVTFDVITYLTTCMWHNPSSVLSDQPSPSLACMAVWLRNLIQLNRFTLPDHQGAVFDSVAQPDLALHEFVCLTAAPIQIHICMAKGVGFIPTGQTRHFVACSLSNLLHVHEIIVFTCSQRLFLYLTSKVLT